MNKEQTEEQKQAEINAIFLAERGEAMRRCTTHGELR